MVSPNSDRRRDALTVKILIAGAFGAGKTTMVAAISEIPVTGTEAMMTVAAEPIDDVSLVQGKTTTTVVMDFGRVTIRDSDGELRLFLFGAPGQDRFWFLWNDLARGALAAIVLADARNLPASWPAIDYFEGKTIPFIVVVNKFDGLLTHDLAEIREALDLPEHIPLRCADVRDRTHVATELRAALTHAMPSDPQNSDTPRGEQCARS